MQEPFLKPYTTIPQPGKIARDTDRNRAARRFASRGFIGKAQVALSPGFSGTAAWVAPDCLPTGRTLHAPLCVCSESPPEKRPYMLGPIAYG
ncbi:hypothetical protein MPNT_70024 [Candidatus Methylacidithermus pantelleriae]|uniref:Uncharacterized protein n=1 Tax=Candidatus Methylacidithermus pantelleriae TaxID=2744239 RepID=A0A8J2BQR5_9BACT|nr:hypothetical protein MPNT_70024 [Candidatus Methylacidithermus pantelleriae]